MENRTNKNKKELWEEIFKVKTNLLLHLIVVNCEKTTAIT